MLNRNDLAKQFELVTKQEIKNYQDSLNFVLQSINELKEDIKQLNSDMLENYGLIHSQHVDLGIQIEHHRLLHIELRQQVSSWINNQQEIKENYGKELAALWGSSVMNQRKSEINENKLAILKESLEKNQNEIIAHTSTIRNSFNDIETKLNRNLCCMKEEIINLPSETEQLKSELEEKIHTHKVDVAGLMKELLSMKHENMITEKKLEHIYTLIDRIHKKNAEEIK